jgi:hypothetical protein
VRYRQSVDFLHLLFDEVGFELRTFDDFAMLSAAVCQFLRSLTMSPSQGISVATLISVSTHSP